MSEKWNIREENDKMRKAQTISSVAELRIK